VTTTTPILRVICHPYAGTWHSLHACNIWPLQPFRRYSWCLPKFKWFTWPNHAPFRDNLSSVGYCAAHSSLTYHDLAPFVLNVTVTSHRFILPLVVCLCYRPSMPYSSLCTLPLSALCLFPIPRPLPLCRWHSAHFSLSTHSTLIQAFLAFKTLFNRSLLRWLLIFLLLTPLRLNSFSLGSKKQLAKIHNSSLDTSHSARNLGLIFDEHLTFSDQITSLSKDC